MKKITLMLLFILLVSCSGEGSLKLTVDIPSETHIEHLFGDTAYFRLTVFDGENVRKRHMNPIERKLEINVHRGSLIIVMLEPPEGYAPLVAWYEPGDERLSPFSYEGIPLIRRLLSAAGERPAIVRDLSLSTVEDAFGNLDGVSPEAFLSELEKGTLNRSSEVLLEARKVTLENLVRGRWESDREGVPPIDVIRSGQEARLSLMPGDYRFMHMEKGLLLRLSVRADGTSASSVGTLLKWS